MTKQFRQEELAKQIMKEDKNILKALSQNDSKYELENLGDLGVKENYDFAVPPEMFHFLKIMEMGAKKHGPDNWLEPNGNKCDEKSMHDSMFHHLAQSQVQGWLAKDEDSKLDPLLHLACRALMLYTRRQWGIVHEKDRR